MADEREVLVEVKNLEVTYGSGRKAYKAVKNANFTIYKGETFGLVGESRLGQDHHWPGDHAHPAHLGRRGVL